jgi:hypothetical protein
VDVRNTSPAHRDAAKPGQTHQRGRNAQGPRVLAETERQQVAHPDPERALVEVGFAAEGEVVEAAGLHHLVDDDPVPGLVRVVDAVASETVEEEESGQEEEQQLGPGSLQVEQSWATRRRGHKAQSSGKPLPED